MTKCGKNDLYAVVLMILSPIKLDMTSLATWKIDLWTAGRLFRGNSTASHCGTLCGPICLHRTTEHQQQTLKALRILKMPTFGPQTQAIVTPPVFKQAFLDSQYEWKIRLHQITWERLVQSKRSQRQNPVKFQFQSR